MHELKTRQIKFMSRKIKIQDQKAKTQEVFVFHHK